MNKKKSFYKVIKSLLKAAKKVTPILLSIACVVLFFKRSINVDFEVMPNGSYSISLIVEEYKDSF